MKYILLFLLLLAGSVYACDEYIYEYYAEGDVTNLPESLSDELANLKAVTLIEAGATVFKSKVCKSGLLFSTEFRHKGKKTTVIYIYNNGKRVGSLQTAISLKRI